VTVIAAILTTKGALMGADSAVSDSSLKLTMADPKIRDFDGTLIGYCGSVNLGRQMFRLIEKDRPVSIVDYIEHLTQAKAWQGVTFLVVERHELWEVEAGAAIHLSDTYASIGSGSPYALGVLHRNHKDLNDLRAALGAAEYYSLEVRGPMLILTA
jgi:hypothetical protein